MAADKSRCDPRTEVQAAGLKAASLGQIHLGGVVGLPFLSIARRWRACCLAMQGPGVMLGPFISSAQEAQWIASFKVDSIHFSLGAIWRDTIEHRGGRRSCTAIVYYLRRSL